MPLSPSWIVCLLFLLSGCTGLVYEVVWTRQLVFLLGGTTYAITTVLVAFMSGLALGSWMSGRIGHRVRQAGRAYGVLEIVVGAYALLVPALLRMADPLYRVLYPHAAGSPMILTAARFCVGALVLLLPSACMGATLPLLVRYLARDRRALGRSTGLLYGVNTCGAMFGTLLAGFVLIPRLGLTRTTWLTAATNVLIGLAAILLLRARQPGDATSATPAPPPTTRRMGQKAATTRAEDAPEVMPPYLRRMVLAVAGLSGFAAMVYQVAWTRALIMSLGSSTYAFTCILAAFILGLGVGSLAVVRWVDRWRRPVLGLALMELGIGLSAVFIVPIHGQLPGLVHDLVVQRHQSYGVLLVTEFALVIAVTFVPTFLMGAIFPLVVRITSVEDRDAGAAVGQAYAVNTVGTIVGSFLAGFVLIRGDVLGIQHSIIAAAALNAIAAACLLMRSGPGGKLVSNHATVGLVGLTLVLIAGLATGDWPRDALTSGPFIYRGDRRPVPRNIRYYFEDVDTTVSVEQVGGRNGRSGEPDIPSSLTLLVNGKADASTGPADTRTQLLLGHLPALLDRDGRKACVIGLGSGMTLAAVARYPSYQRIDCIELSEGVIEAASAKEYDTDKGLKPEDAGPHFPDFNYDVLRADPRVRLIRADARNHLLLTDETYDLIVSEPSNPWLAGVANLFTREFFDLCRRRLAPQGVLGIWLQGYSTSEESFRMVVRTLFDVFDSVSIWEAGLSDYLLIARPGLQTIPLSVIQARFDQPSVQYDLNRAALRDVGTILGNYVAGGPPLRNWVGDSVVHTDDNAILEFRAPWDLYARQHVRISRSLLELQSSPIGYLVTPDGVPAQQVHITDAKIVGCFEARRLRVLGVQEWETTTVAAAIGHLIEGYTADPGNFLVFQVLMDYAGQLESRPGRRRTYEALVKAIDNLPIPVAMPMGGSRADILDLLKKLADEATRNHEASAAAVYLRQARELTPDDHEAALPQQKPPPAATQRDATAPATSPK